MYGDPNPYKIPNLQSLSHPSTAQINHIRYKENIKIYWEKFESHKPTIQCFRCQAHGHTLANCNKKAVCVKCAGSHDSRVCKKTLEIPSTCANSNRNHPANNSICPPLLVFLSEKKYIHKYKIQTAPQPLTSPFQSQYFSSLLHNKTTYPLSSNLLYKDWNKRYLTCKH